jgi:REP element-mobilizing transposase RayT
MSDPLAYLLTWTTYGSWLPGDQRGWVAKTSPGIQDPDPNLETNSRKRLRYSRVSLNPAQRFLIEATIEAHCEVRRWKLHAVNARTNHIHVVVTAPGIHPDVVMNQFKAWCSRRLNEYVTALEARENPSLALGAGKCFRRRWWTKGGSTKWINDNEYLQNTNSYVLEGQ